MNDALLVCGLERLGDLFRDRQRLVDWDRAARDRLRQILALDEFHHEGVQAGRFLEPIDRRDVRMIEGGERLCLALEPGQPFGVRGERVRQDLDRDLATERRVCRPVDLSHPPIAD